MWLNRRIREEIYADSFQGKVAILVGPRQVGKTSLLTSIAQQLAEEGNKKILFINGDDPKDRELISDKSLDFLRKLIGNADIVLIDEGQKVKSIGQTLKLLVDFYAKKKQIFVTGSSTFNLLDSTQEYLTGRKFVYHLYPFSFEEIFSEKNYLKIQKNLEDLLIFGSYPEVFLQNSYEGKLKRLKEISSSYLYKDILEHQNIKNPDLLFKLLKALSLQIGAQVSANELSNLIGVDKNTIERYIDLLEKNFIIFRLSPYSSNKRREISKLKKVFFYDLGIRNSVINNFNFLDQRNDTGVLFENYMILERLKMRQYHNIYANQYFWRTYDGAEVDLVEEKDGALFGYEFKWTAKNARCPKKWLSYPNSSFEVFHKENLDEFLTIN